MRYIKKHKLKVLLITFLLIPVAAITIYTTLYIRKLRTDSKILVVDINELYHMAEATMRQNEERFKIAFQLLNTADTITAKLKAKEELCRLEIEEGTDHTNVAAAYDCLAELNIANGTPDSIYAAIRNLSYALDIQYSEQRSLQLSKLITNGYDKEIKAALDGEGVKALFDTWATGYASDEIFFLNMLASSQIPDLTSKALYRLSLIHQLGRASFADKYYMPNAEAALEAKTKALANFKPNLTPRNIDIAMAIDDNYAPHAAVTMASALLTANPETFYHFYFILDPNNPLSKVSQEKLKSMQNIKEYKITFLTFPMDIVPDGFFKNDKTAFTSFPQLVIYRLLLEDILPKLSTIIYLDSDMIVKRDLGTLLEKNSENHYITGVVDPDYMHMAKIKKRCVNQRIYLNSGLLILNLDKMRRENSSDAIFNIVKNPKCTFFADQDIMNLAFQGNMKEISTRWNMPVGAPTLTHLYWNSFGEFITHFIVAPLGVKSAKPWLFPNAEQIWMTNPYGIPAVFRDYWSYRNLTQWKVGSIVVSTPTQQD